MTRIDFHSNVSNQLDYACRLVRKALAAQCKLVVVHQDENQLAQFDQLLWAFSAADFLPHVVLNQGSHPLAKQTPVLLTLFSDTSVAETELQHNEILINLSEQVPPKFAQYERLIEIVPKESESLSTQVAVQAGRNRYRFYQQQGYQLNHIIAK